MLKTNCHTVMVATATDDSIVFARWRPCIPRSNTWFIGPETQPVHDRFRSNCTKLS